MLGRCFPTFRRPRTQAVGGRVVSTEVCPTGKSVEVPPVPQEGLEKLLHIRGEFLDGLALARYLFGSGKELLPGASSRTRMLARVTL